MFLHWGKRTKDGDENEKHCRDGTHFDDLMCLSESALFENDA